jgi:hypothetical protein
MQADEGSTFNQAGEFAMQTQTTEWGAALMPSLAEAMALGLSFGLGGLETAAEIVRNWYLKGA